MIGNNIPDSYQTIQQHQIHSQRSEAGGSSLGKFIVIPTESCRSAPCIGYPIRREWDVRVEGNIAS